MKPPYKPPVKPPVFLFLDVLAGKIPNVGTFRSQLGNNCKTYGFVIRNGRFDGTHDGRFREQTSRAETRINSGVLEENGRLGGLC